MTRIAAACGGFLLAVLWMDLMFDVQAFRLDGGPADAAVIGSIAGYYRRVTTDAFPMNRLIAAVMAVAVVVSLVRLIRGITLWRAAALALAVLPITLAAVRVVPNAVRLGAMADPLAAQVALAQAILHDHLACFAAIAAFTTIQLLAKE